jgi:hypothetical protein
MNLLIRSRIYPLHVFMVSYDEVGSAFGRNYLTLIFMFYWQFSSRHDRPKGWYVIALIVVLFLVVYGIWEGTYLMPIAAFLFA